MKSLTAVDSRQELSPTPASSCSDGDNALNTSYEQLSHLYGLDSSRIEAIKPCTPFQLDMIDCTTFDKKSAIGHAVYDVPTDIDISRFTLAWKEIVNQTPALRAFVFTSNSGKSCQVILKDNFVFSWMCWSSSSFPYEVVRDEAAAAASGPRCNRFVLLEDMQTKKRQLVWTFSHAFVGNAFQKRVLGRVLAAYKHGKDTPRPETPDSSDATDTDSQSASVESMSFEDNATSATQFWQTHLNNLGASVFPHLSDHLMLPNPIESTEHRITFPLSQKTPSSTVICRAALSILLSYYTHSDEALFGVVTEQCITFGKHCLTDGSYQTVAPLRVHCESDLPVSDIMDAISSYDDHLGHLAPFGLRDIRNTGDDGSAACDFQTVLLVTDGSQVNNGVNGFLQQTTEPSHFMPCNNRALLLHCQMESNGALLVAHYDRNVIDSLETKRLLEQLGHLINYLYSSSDLGSMADINLMTEYDCAEIQMWNSQPLEVQNTLIHHEMLKTVSHSPTKTAIQAWDGEWTYSELDNISSRLATHITSLGLGAQQAIIPIYFEKSKWVIASMLAVLKSGNAFTLIDPNDPPARTAQVVSQTRATVALTSKLHRETVQKLTGRCVVVDDELLQSVPASADFSTTIKSQDLAYVIFTSGSTGDPKGIMIEHRAFSSCALKFGASLGISSDTRALQFGTHAFGACLLEIMTTLIHGGCVCIPSDDDRMNNIPSFINRYNVNWMMATPSYMGTFAPEDVPGLATLVLVGEQMSASVNAIWAPKVQLLNGYGQSESSSICFASKMSAEPNNMGRAVGAHSWVIDPNDINRLVPIGAVGELVIESPGIARDYIVPPPPEKSPFFTNIPSWYSSGILPDGVKFYRTGDLARYASDGSIVCLGRMDSQVKIRGQRVELGAIETHLRRQMPDDLTIVVEATKRSQSVNSTALIAFLIGSSCFDNKPLDAYILDHDAAKVINMKLEQVLPRHSIPSFYICMLELPRTATGKIDRRRLRMLGNDILDEQTQGTIVQQTPAPIPVVADTAAKLYSIWVQSLAIDPAAVNIGATFFELGGNSITAIKMVNMARSAGMDLKVSDIYQNPTLARLSAVIKGDPLSYTLIPKSTHDGPIEQSYSQGRLWFLDQLDVGSLWYLIPYAVKMRGPINVDALRRALAALEQRHETLRTTFEDQDGVGVQIVHENLSKEVKVIDLSDSDLDPFEVLNQEQTTPFNLSSEAGWRATLLRLGEDEHILTIVMHHIISDGWSIDVLRRDLNQLYSAALKDSKDPLSALVPLPIQYSDFAKWQKDQFIEQEKQLDYWKKQLKDSSPAKIPTDFARPALLSGDAGCVSVTIDGELYQSLRAFCNQHNTTSFVVLLAAFRAAHYRLTAVEDAVIGTPIANRNRPELEDIIGCFVNTQCMRINIDDNDTFGTLVNQVKATTTAAFENEDVPFERVVSALQPGSRDLSSTPLAQLIFAVHSQKDLGRFSLEGLESLPVPSKAYTRFDMEFHLFQETDSLKGSVNFADELFKMETVENVVRVFFEILRKGLQSAQTPVSVLPLTDGIATLEQLDVLNVKHVDYPRESSLVDVFQSQVSTFPDSLAVVDSSFRLTYSELDRQSDVLAGWLRRRSMLPETLVAVFAPRSCETIVAFFGILKANLAYLPLDVRSPSARVQDILSGLSGPTVVFLGHDTEPPEIQVPNVEFVRIQDALQECNTDGFEVLEHNSKKPSATSLAYVLYTSGSTGRPKGVMIEHRVIIRTVTSGCIPNYPAETRMAHMATIAFDGASYEIYSALLFGRTLVCIDYMTTLDARALKDVFFREHVNAAVMSPALLKMYLSESREALKSLDVLLLGGDRFDGPDALDAQGLIKGQCYNGYGPTENGVMSTIYPIDSTESFINGVPIGRALNNSGAYVMDPQQQLVGIGVMGELVVTGDGLARGYTDKALDENRFVHITINGQTVKAYRTGDRVRHRIGDGLIEFFGRMDTQFKIRGNRIESAEVEAALLRDSSVRDAAVVLQQNEDQAPEIFGFVVADHGHSENDKGQSANQVEGWQDHFESGMYSDIGEIDLSTIGSDFKGWTSMYDGSQIDFAEMHEWLGDTTRTLHDNRSPGNVLEIGTGSGMILFNLDSRLESYVGLEPSRSAAAFVNKAVESVPSLAEKAKVHVGTATDVGQIGNLHPDLVVLNSVIQYFPSSEYLAEVADTLVHLPDVKRIFFGDVRSQATNEHFLAARAVRTLGENATKNDVRQKMAELEDVEEELLVEPAFFTSLEDKFPDLVENVEILPKNMEAVNELSAYRYAAVVHIRGSIRDEAMIMVEKDDWIDFQAKQLDQKSLGDLLTASGAAIMAVSNIPFKITAFERHVVASLNSDIDEWQLSAIRSTAEGCTSLSVPDIFRIAEEAGFRVEVSAARQWSQNGALDAVFHHCSSQGRTLVNFPTDHHLRGSDLLTNRPLQRLQNRRIAIEVRERLRSLLPSYMIPSNIVVLDKMPLNANGKVDRKELSRRAKVVPKQQTATPVPTFPISEVEVILCEEATEVFGMKVDITDHFFNLGGHSLLATKLISRIDQRLKVRVTVKDVFDHPVFADLASVVRQGLGLQQPVSDGQGQDKSAHVAPRTETEAMLCDEFAKVLGFQVGITDNFFDLGGHSLMATKLAVRIGHRLETTVSVKDVFDHPVLFQLAIALDNLVQSKTNERVGSREMAEYSPFQLLSTEDSEDFMANEIRPRLELQETIQDVYPSTQMQKAFLFDPTTARPRPFVPFYIDFPSTSEPDAGCLVRACESLVGHLDIFRTVFVEASGELYQVVLSHLDLPVQVIETEDNINTATNEFLDVFAKEPVRLGQPLVRFTILKQTKSMRVIMRISHALYDGLSLEHVVRKLHMLYNGRSLLPPHQFSRYMQYTADSRESGHQFWRDVIQNTPMTILSDDTIVHGDVATCKALHLSNIVDIPSQVLRGGNNIITQATVFNAACALVLSQESGSKDVVFGRIVSGRQGLPVEYQDIVGPCTNAVPVRAHIESSDHNQLLHDIQDQYLLSLPHETIGFSDLKRNCTDWPEEVTNYSCCITYHNFEYHPESQFEQQRVEMGVLTKFVNIEMDEPLYDLAIAGEVEPDGKGLKVTVIAKTQLFGRKRVEHLLNEVSRTFEDLNSSL
ncbi:Beauvericin nonribosomal cyclodepsipeptide synthetase bea1 [Fusarium poae]|nr:Beauvericin nonribosomal cyclodepsipeptide synthetase bea1 [Fusarium poae]KAG8666688.1 Beauvericin nonribosomal cyclodepsipeptide synthetase bea1 [Fusarium poae]